MLRKTASVWCSFVVKVGTNLTQKLKKTARFKKIHEIKDKHAGTKRDGRTETMMFDKITARIKKLSWSLILEM